MTEYKKFASRLTFEKPPYQPCADPYNWVTNFLCCHFIPGWLL